MRLSGLLSNVTRGVGRLATWGLGWLAVAVIVKLLFTSPDPTLFLQDGHDVDFAWGSILHRFQNHPSPARPRQPFPWSSHSADGSSPGPVRTLIVTAELAGLHNNGGIGTAFLELAHALAKNKSIEVTILVAHLAESFPIAQRAKTAEHLSAGGIKLQYVETETQPFFPQSWTPVASMRVYKWLQTRDSDFDIVHFPDNTGIGYFSALARLEGLILLRTKIIVGLHGADVEWAAILNKRYPFDRYGIELGEFERRTAEMADVVVAPSSYMLEYLGRRGWRLPVHAYVIPNIVAVPSSPFLSPAQGVDEITELVFFGRMEERKGTRLFIQALELLFIRDSKFQWNGVRKITFLGRDVHDRDSDSESSTLLTEALITLRANSDIAFDFDFITNYDRDEALDYLRNSSRLAVLPSLGDNSPSTILECISHSIRFIASSVGGIPELIHPSEHDTVLFAPLATKLASKLSETVQSLSVKPWTLVRPSNDTLLAAEQWMDLHGWLKTQPYRQISLAKDPFVTICITHYERTHLVSQLLDSLLAQTYTNFEVILIDDGSQSVEAVAGLKILEQKYLAGPNWKLVRGKNSYLGEARNRAASYARGSHLLFLDDDDVLKPYALGRLVDVAKRTNASLLSTWLDEFATDVNPLNSTSKLPHRRTYWFLGQSLAAGMISNCFGSGNIFVTKEVFNKIGGFSSYREVGGEDWQFYVRAALANFTHLVVPEELIFVRSDPSRDSMKFSMDPWDAGFHALVPILNDRRVQELGISHTLLLAKAAVSPKNVPRIFTDSYADFQLIQGWNGWTYFFEPVDVAPTSKLQNRAFITAEQWTRTSHQYGPPYIVQDAQHPYVSAKGTQYAAVRTFTSPAKTHVNLHLSFKAAHECGDGTRLRLLADTGGPDDPRVLYSTNTLQNSQDDFRIDLHLFAGSKVHLISDPLETDECDQVETRLTLTLAKANSKAWSTLAKHAELKKAAEQKALDFAKEEMQSNQSWVAVTEQHESDDDDEDDDDGDVGNEEEEESATASFNIALIFDKNRLSHAKQVIRSAVHFIKTRRLRFHLVAPLELHDEMYEFFADSPLTLTLYDHALCYKHARQVIPFSDPSIHISAHCKMFLSEILTFTERVLYLDTDVSIVNDVSNCYGEPENPEALLSMGVDMGDICQNFPNECWPIGLHWRLPSNLICGNIPEKAGSRPKECARAGELETLQVNGGVVLFELQRMRQHDFVTRYSKIAAYHFSLTGFVAQWGEQDFINSYFRLFPEELEFLPCGCNYQWFGNRKEIKCGAQPVYIAHAWSHGLATRNDNVYNKMFHFFLDNNQTINASLQYPELLAKPPVLPLASAVVENTPRFSNDDIENNRNCPRQSHDCSIIFSESEYGQSLMVLSRMLGETFAEDLVESVASQAYQFVSHYMAARVTVQIPYTTVDSVVIPIDDDAFRHDYDALCDACGTFIDENRRCDTPPLGIHREAFLDCYCNSPDSTSSFRYDLDALATEAGWILYLDDDQIFSSENSISHLMSKAVSIEELIVFRTGTLPTNDSLSFRKKNFPRGPMKGVGFMFHSTHQSETDWDGTRCGIWKTFEHLSSKLKIKWIDEVPVLEHPLQHHLILHPAIDFGLTVIIQATQGREYWTAAMVEALQTSEMSRLVYKVVIVSTDGIPGEYGEDVPVLRPSVGSGLSQLAIMAETDGVLLLSDSVLINKAGLTSLIDFWLDNPKGIVGPFSDIEQEFYDRVIEQDEEGFNFDEEHDALVGHQEFTTVLPRALLVHRSYLERLTNLNLETPTHPWCHGLLLNALVSNTTHLPPLRVRPPPASLVDRVYDCRLRGFPDVTRGLDATRSRRKDQSEVEYAQCVEYVSSILGSSEESWSIPSTQVGWSGTQGLRLGFSEEGLEESGWQEARRVDTCHRT